MGTWVWPPVPSLHSPAGVLAVGPPLATAVSPAARDPLLPRHVGGLPRQAALLLRGGWPPWASTPRPGGASGTGHRSPDPPSPRGPGGACPRPPPGLGLPRGPANPRLWFSFQAERPALNVVVFPLLHEGLTDVIRDVPMVHLDEVTLFKSRVAEEPPNLWW